MKEEDLTTKSPNNQMQKRVIFSVDLKNLSDFSYFPGAEEFRQKYIHHEYDYSYFSFDISKDEWPNAENELSKSKLQYRKFFEIVLNKNEISEYPVFNLTIPAIYDLVDTENLEQINYSEMGSAVIAEDFKSRLLVIDIKIMETLSALNPDIKPINEITYINRNKKYQLLKNIPILKPPRIIIAASGIKENIGEYTSTFYADGWDGRSTLSDDGIDFIKNEHLAASWFFEFKNATYRQNTPNYLISGVFADKITKMFKQKVQCTPLTMGNI